ncbi:MAG: metal-dependent phosphohydrolase [Propionibacteriales bacterium]|nr:metal-dependent phosphohydrolase [Propionibacteriales bacterium]
MDELFERLRERYREPHRHYHDVRHLEEVLATVDELAPEASDPDAVRMAAWFHDAVYVPRAADNEERSAELARAELSAAGAAAEQVDEVVRLVQLTETHKPAPGDLNGAVLCDADLRILAADGSRYAEYVRGVRREYAHVGEAEFRRGRARILRSLIDDPPVFHTGTARKRWEERARSNLRAELADLTP